MILLREHGVGTSSTVQPYLDQFIATAAQQNGWDAASAGRFESKRDAADTWIKANDPHYGIFSLAAFLAMRKQYGLDPDRLRHAGVGGGEQYFIVSMNQGSLADCKGKQLATDHDDQVFVEKIVADGAFTMADFTLVKTRRFGEAGFKVQNGEAECALIDDAQLDHLRKGAPAIKSPGRARSCRPCPWSPSPRRPRPKRLRSRLACPRSARRARAPARPSV